MAKSAVLSVAMLAMTVAAAGPVLAQQVQEGDTPPPAPPEYVLEGDLLIKDGDQAFDCAGSAQYVQESGVNTARRELALCYQYGFSPSDGAQASATQPPAGVPSPAPGEASAQEQQPSTAVSSTPQSSSTGGGESGSGSTGSGSSGDDRDATLPSTGGHSLIALCAGALLTAGWFALRRRVR